MLFDHWEKILLRELVCDSVFDKSLADAFSFFCITIVTVSAAFFLLVFTTILRYLHHRLVVMRGRPAWAQEDDERILWQWIGLESGEGGTLNSER
jgi:hypothetical protein